MPSRVIRGEINSSESLSMVSPEAELVFRALLLAVDDYGRGDARPSALKADLFPMRDAFTAKKIGAWIDELAALPDPPVRLYEVGGRRYLWLPNWEKHRGGGRRAATSRFPDPPSYAQEILGDPRKAQEILPSSEGRVARDEGRVANTRAARGVKVECPEALSEPEQEALVAWCREKHPDLVSMLPEIWGQVVIWARAHGHRRASWYATAQTFVNRRATEGNHGPIRSGPSNGRRLTAVEAGRKIVADFERRSSRESEDVRETIHVVPVRGESGF